jgi:hypothetical protein
MRSSPGFAKYPPAPVAAGKTGAKISSSEIFSTHRATSALSMVNPDWRFSMPVNTAVVDIIEINAAIRVVSAERERNHIKWWSGD